MKNSFAHQSGKRLVYRHDRDSVALGELTVGLDPDTDRKLTRDDSLTEIGGNLVVEWSSGGRVDRQCSRGLMVAGWYCGQHYCHIIDIVNMFACKLSGSFSAFAPRGLLREIHRLLGGFSLLGLGIWASPNAAFAQRTPSPRSANIRPRTILLRAERLAESKHLVASGDAAIKPTIDALLEAARAALDAPSLNVMQKGRIPPSGNKHDYMSMAPYFWPNPATANGLPFVNRDGEMYPESRKDHDGLRLQETIARVRALALAWYLSDDPRYSRGAARHLRVFFLDTATRMNPNLNFAQAVLGVTEGRGIGIIDTRDLPALVDALRLLDGAPGWTRRDMDGMITWCRAYLRWLLESKNGTEERATINNHGVFYDAQVAALALFVGDSVLAAQTIGESAKNRIASQIDGDGRQKLELDRTRPLHYSLFNLDAFTMLAEMARHVGVDLWHYTAPAEAASRRQSFSSRHMRTPASDFQKPISWPWSRASSYRR
jgi:hypothetical protein